MLSNPLGSHFIDFPGSFYQHVMKAELSGFAKCVDAVGLKDAAPKAKPGGGGGGGEGEKWWKV